MPRLATFPGRPDVLDLILTAETPADVSIKQIVSAFGQSEERFFFYRDIPLGMISDLMPYHKSLGLLGHENTLVILAPALRELVPFPAITLESFREALTQLLSSTGMNWTLICERDCDQESILHFEATTSEAQDQLSELFRFLDGQSGVTCPTFVVTKKANRVEVAGLRLPHHPACGSAPGGSNQTR